MKATGRPPARLTLPAGGSVASSRMVITTTASCPLQFIAHIGQLTDVLGPAMAHAANT